jgi:predicted alpha/beta-hydrolase family hydrolase
MRLGPVLVASALLVALAGCGGKDSAATKATAEGPIGKGASGVWIYTPAGKPKDVVVFFHGQGGPKEATPANHLPWIKHLVSRGSVVIYPRYEIAFEEDPMSFIVNGVREGRSGSTSRGCLSCRSATRVAARSRSSTPRSPAARGCRSRTG